MDKKLLRGALLEAVLLHFISDASDRGLHGYAIFLAVYKRFGIRLSPSVLYPELSFLERQGFIESSWQVVSGRARRTYYITRNGRKLLGEYSMALKIVVPTFVDCIP